MNLFSKAVAVILLQLSLTASAGPIVGSTHDVFTQLGWYRSSPNEQLVESKTGQFNFNKLTGFRIFMDEVRASRYDYIRQESLQVDLVLTKIVQNSFGASELHINFIHPYGDYRERVEKFEEILSKKLGRLKVTYIPSNSDLGGALISSGKSFSDPAFMVEVLKSISKQVSKN